MKKFFLFAAVAAMVTMVSCNKEAVIETPAEEVGEGYIELSVKADVAGDLTKASDITENGKDDTVVDVQILVFGADGGINYYFNNGNTMTKTISATPGAKTVYAVINGPDLSDTETLSAFETSAVELGEANIPGTKFLMVGSGTCTVVKGQTCNCDITASRLVSRFKLVSVENALAGGKSLTINRVMLINAPANQNFKGDAAVSTWYNQEGRADEATRNTAHIIDGSNYLASAANLTFKAVGEPVNSGAKYETASFYYMFPNASTEVKTGFNSPFAAQASKLVVVATIDSQVYFYPVTLYQSDGAVVPARNTSYDVTLKITGFGSDDPNTPVEKGTLNVSIVKAPWVAGAEFNVEY